jgi:hypothetical protein
MDIIFTNTSGASHIQKPEPSSKVIPQWYKDVDSYINGEKKPNIDGRTMATIKRCMPVFDAIISGYIIYSSSDVYVSQQVGYGGVPYPHYTWPSMDMIDFHPIEQAPNHPLKNVNFSYPKWTNPWGIKTPKGYSVLITQPFHRESVFTILPGIVDTDTYNAPVNFPFVLNDPSYEGLIPAGTPLAQIIPFKREQWNMKLGNEKDVKNQNEIRSKLNMKFFDRYKTMHWSKKEYR